MSHSFFVLKSLIQLLDFPIFITCASHGLLDLLAVDYSEGFITETSL
jgi:hypothetical protein